MVERRPAHVATSAVRPPGLASLLFTGEHRRELMVDELDRVPLVRRDHDDRRELDRLPWAHIATLVEGHQGIHLCGEHEGAPETVTLSASMWIRPALLTAVDTLTAYMCCP